MAGELKMDVREKLIGILRKPIFPHELVDPIEAVADYLLDSGVTVQEWISVNDRLPEFCVSVLARCFYNGKWRTLVCHTSKENAGEWYTDEVCQWVKVTHWMPLPLAPEEETDNGC